jgi:hypothetical protein
MCRQPSLWHLSFYIASHGCKVSIAGVPYRAREVADVFGVLCELLRSVTGDTRLTTITMLTTSSKC